MSDQITLSEIKKVIKQKLSLEFTLSSHDIKHRLPHIHVFTGENEVSFDYLNNDILAPNPSELKKSDKKALKELFNFLQKNPKFVEVITEEFYLRNPQLRQK